MIGGDCVGTRQSFKRFCIRRLHHNEIIHEKRRVRARASDAAAEGRERARGTIICGINAKRVRESSTLGRAMNGWLSC